MPAEPSTAHESRRKGTEASIRLSVPLPPAALRGNAKVHWAERKRAADEYSAQVYSAAFGVDIWPDPKEGLATAIVTHRRTLPWKAAAVEYDWHYAGARPDLDNVARSIKVLQDTLCCARPVKWNDTSYLARYFLGLIEDDGGIEPVTFKRTKVAHKNQEAVVVTITRLEDGDD